MERRLEVLGGFAMTGPGGPLRLRSAKSRALLGLLCAARGRAMPRARAAALLWERSDPESARVSLRQALSQIRRAGGDGWVEAEAETLRVPPDVSTDLSDFAAALSRGEDAAAARAYGGPFLDGLAPGDPDLDAAIAAERARLADLVAGALAREMARLGTSGEGAQMAHRLLAVDPLNEAAHRCLMARDAGRGARSAARARFDALKDALARELGAEPERETAALMLRIRGGHGSDRPAAEAPAAPLARETEPDLLLLALGAEGKADWPMVEAAVEEAGGHRLGAGPGEMAARWPSEALHRVSNAALGMADRAGEGLSFALVPLSDAAGRAGDCSPADLAKARRMAARADPGTVLLAPDLARRLGIEVAGGPARLEGTPAARPAPPLVGREIELAQIEAAVRAARAERRGVVVHLSGEAGIGKSRLAEEVARLPGPSRVLRIGFAALSSGGRHIGQEIMASLPADRDRAPGDPYAAAVRAWLAGERLSAEQELRLTSLGTDARRRRILDALERALEAASAEGLLLLVEDCHWAPGGAAEFLLDLAERMAALPVVLLLTERPHEASLDRRLAARGAVALVRLRLAPLSPQAAERLAQIAAPGRPRMAEAVKRARGHPLFLLGLLESGPSSGDLPATVRSLVLEQIERLLPQEREALRRASVLGTTFDPGDLAAIFPELARLAPHGDLLHAAGGGLAFGHDLIRQAIHDDLPAARRTEWHARAAKHFRGTDAVRWAEHAALAEDAAEACRAHVAAANAMIVAMRMPAAMQHVEAGLARGGDDEAVAELHSCRAGIRRMRGDLSGALDDYRQAYAAARSDVTRVAMLVRQALVLHRLDRGAEADRTLDDAEHLADRIGLSGPGRAEIHEQRGNRAFVAGAAQECLRQHRLGLDAAEAAADPRGIARAHGGLGDAHVLSGRLRTAHGHFDRAVSIAAGAGLGMVHQEFAFMRGFSLFYAEPGPRAHLMADLAVESAAGAGADRAEMLARNVRAEMRLCALDLAGASEDIERSAVLIARDPEARFAADLAFMRAWLDLRGGDPSAAFARIEPHLGAARESYYNGPSILGLGALAASEGECRTELLRAGEARVRAGTMPTAALGYHCFALECAAIENDADLGRSQLRHLDALAGIEALGLVDLARRAARARFGPSTAGETETGLRRALAAARLQGLGSILTGG